MDEQSQDDQLRTYVQQICADTECNLEDLQGAMDDRGGRSLLAVRHHDDDDTGDVFEIEYIITDFPKITLIFSS